MGLATVYMRQGRTEEALKAADHAIELDPNRADLRATRAEILHANADSNDARVEFPRALALDPGSSDVAFGSSSIPGAPASRSCDLVLTKICLFLCARKPRSMGDPGLQMDPTMDDQRRWKSLPARWHRCREFHRQHHQEPAALGCDHDWWSDGAR